MSRQLPLAGKQIVVTRARRQAPRLEALIRGQGGIPVRYPCIDIVPTDPAALDIGLRQLDAFDWLVFSSGNAVWALAERARAMGVEQNFVRAKIATVGPATSAELRRQLGRNEDFTPTSYSAEDLARQLPLEPGAQILLPQSDLADPAASDILHRRGGNVTRLVAYRTLVGQGGADLPSLITDGKIDALTFASPSAVRFFRQRCPLAAALLLPAVCFGSSAANAATGAGFQNLITPPAVGQIAMISALSKYFVKRRR